MLWTGERTTSNEYIIVDTCDSFVSYKIVSVYVRRPLKLSDLARTFHIVHELMLDQRQLFSSALASGYYSLRCLPTESGGKPHVIGVLRDLSFHVH